MTGVHSHCGFLHIKTIVVLFVLIGSLSGQAFWWENVRAKQLTVSNFDKIVGKGKYVLVEFYTKSCGYCRQFYPDLNRLQEEFMGKSPPRTDIVIAKIDAEEERDLSRRYGISSYPTIVLFFPNNFNFPQKYMFDRNFQVMREYLMILPPSESNKVSAEDKSVYEDEIKALKRKLKEVK